MSAASEIAVGLAGGAVITVAAAASGLRPLEGLAIGGSAGLVLALTERSRTTGLALIAASIAGMAATSQRQRRSLRSTRLARSLG
jgi:pimeloyl-ACP methyl ester carboxylesterase